MVKEVEGKCQYNVFMCTVHVNEIAPLNFGEVSVRPSPSAESMPRMSRVQSLQFRDNVYIRA